MQVLKCLRNSCLGSLDCLLIAFYDIMTWSYVSSCLKVLEVFNLKIQNQAKLYAQFYQYPFQSRTYENQTHRYPMHCELAQVWCLQWSLDWFISMGSFTYTPSTRIHEMWLPNGATPPWKERKGWTKFMPCLTKKKEKGEVCNVIHQTTMEYISVYHLHLTHEMSI